MPDKLGSGSYNGTQLAIDIHSSHDIADIQAQYEPEIKQIRNEMRNHSEDKTSSEYFELMSELQELEDERDSKVKQLENEDTDREKMFETQDSQLEDRYNAVKADKEGLEEAQKSDIQS